MTDVVEIDGIQFVGDEFAELVYSELKDWDGVTDSRGRREPVPGQHGDYAATEIVRDSRAISFEGGIVADTVERFFELKRRIESISSVCEMRVDQGDGFWARSVEIDRIDVPDFHLRTFTPFTIDLVAPDPVRYRMLETAGPVGVPSREGGLILPKAFPWDFGFAVQEYARVENVGSVPVYPVVVVQGSASSITVFGGPRRLGFGAFDGTLRFDSADRRGFLNGVEVTRRMTRRDWPMIPAGVSHDFYFSAVDPSPDLSLFVEYRIGAW